MSNFSTIPESIVKPEAADMRNAGTFGKYFGGLQRSETPLATTASQTGTSENLTMPSLSDIMQGTFSQNSPDVLYSVLNQGLSKQLSMVQQLGGAGGSLFQNGDALSFGATSSNPNTPGVSGSGNDPRDGNGGGSNPVDTGATSPTPDPSTVYAAGQKLLAHPNFWMGKNGSNSGAIINQFTKGIDVPNDITVMGKTWTAGHYTMAPALINILWYLCEKGFIIGTSYGMFVPNDKNGDGKSMSAHAVGMAVDIGAIGRASAGQQVNIADSRCHDIIVDMYNALCDLPDMRMPEQVGGPFDFDPSTRTVLPSNDNAGGHGTPTSYYTNSNHAGHIHLGVGPDPNAGGLLPVFNGSPSGTTVNG